MFIEEIFYSYQGEGVWIGYPQIFIRLYGCSLTCAYCDQPDTNKEPYTVDKVLEAISQYSDVPVHSISITGGEPMEQIEALETLLPELPYPIFLETNGVHPDTLPRIINFVDYFSVDFKPGYDAPFSKFMAQLSDHPQVYAKYILLHQNPDAPFKKMVDILSAINPDIPLIIQPVTPYGTVTHRPTRSDIDRAYSIASESLNDVRVIGQAHKLIGVQ